MVRTYMYFLIWILQRPGGPPALFLGLLAGPVYPQYPRKRKGLLIWSGKDLLYQAGWVVGGGTWVGEPGPQCPPNRLPAVPGAAELRPAPPGQYGICTCGQMVVLPKDTLLQLLKSTIHYTAYPLNCSATKIVELQNIGCIIDVY